MPLKAILTGASSGVGRALAPLLANAGYSLALIGRDAIRLDAAFASLPMRARGRSFTLVRDLANIEETSRVFDDCRAHWGDGIDLLVNCAGYGTSGPIEEIPLDAFERSFRVNYLAAVSLARQVIASMKAQQSGSIVNLTSGVARRSLPFISPYASAKAALNAFTDSLRVELAPHGIHVLLFSPGPVASAFQASKRHYGESPLDFPPFHGENPEWVARALFHAISKKKKRVTLGTRARIAHHLHYWSPTLSDFLTRSMYRLSKS